MAKSENIEPRGTIQRLGEHITKALDPRVTLREIPTVAALLIGRIQRRERENVWRRYNAGLIKKAELIAYAENGTRHQKKVARQVLGRSN